MYPGASTFRDWICPSTVRCLLLPTIWDSMTRAVFTETWVDGRKGSRQQANASPQRGTRHFISLSVWSRGGIAVSGRHDFCAIQLQMFFGGGFFGAKKWLSRWYKGVAAQCPNSDLIHQPTWWLLNVGNWVFGKGTLRNYIMEFSCFHSCLKNGHLIQSISFVSREWDYRCSIPHNNILIAK